ncbi:MAG: hypothetical protein WBD84_00615 [Methyloceanibacter sp.]
MKESIAGIFAVLFLSAMILGAALGLCFAAAPEELHKDRVRGSQEAATLSCRLWPVDVRDHAQGLAKAALEDQSSA